MIYIAIIMGMVMSLIFFMLGRMDPIAYFFYFDVVAFIIAMTLIVGILARLRKSGSWVYFDKPKRNNPVLEFLYRDGGKRPIYGTRIPGTGFFQAKGLGIIMDVGRLPEPGSVYIHGDKAIRFVLQDINHTPNPKFTGYYRFLTKIGFNRMEEVQEVVTGYNPELMAKVWNRLVDHKPKKAVDRMVEDIKDMTPEEMKQVEKIESGTFTRNTGDKTINDKITELLGRKNGTN